MYLCCAVVARVLQTNMKILSYATMHVNSFRFYLIYRSKLSNMIEKYFRLNDSKKDFYMYLFFNSSKMAIPFSFKRIQCFFINFYQNGLVVICRCFKQLPF